MFAAAAGIGLPVHDARERIRDDWAEGGRRRVVGAPHFFIGRDGFFCPTLEISRTGGRLTITDNGLDFEASSPTYWGSDRMSLGADGDGRVPYG